MNVAPQIFTKSGKNSCLNITDNIYNMKNKQHESMENDRSKPKHTHKQENKHIHK